MRSIAIILTAVTVSGIGCAPQERVRDEGGPPNSTSRPSQTQWVSGLLEIQDPTSPDDGAVKLELYDVQDLTYGLEDFTDAKDSAAEEGARQFLTGDDLANLVRYSVHEDRWEDANGKTIHFDNGLLIVRNTLEVHKGIRAFLALLREQFRVLHFIEVRLLEMEAGSLSSLPRCGAMTRREMAEFWQIRGRRESVRAAGAIAAGDAQLVHVRDASLAIEIRPLWSPPDTILIESRLDVQDRGWRGRTRSTLRVPDGGGVVFALGRDEGRIRYLVLQARTEAGNRKGRAVVLCPETGLAPGSPVLALCDIRDLVFRIREFPLRRLPAPVGKTGATIEEGNEGTVGQDQIIELCKEAAQPGSWEGENTIELTPSQQLLIHHQREVIVKTEELLSRLNRFAGRAPITLRMTILELDARTVSRFLDPLWKDHEAMLCDPKDSARLEEAWSSGKVTEDLSFSCFNTQRAHAISRRRAGGGAWLDARPVLDSEGSRCTVEIRAGLLHPSSKGKPEPQAIFDEDDWKSSTRWAMTLSVPVGGAVVLPLGPSPETKDTWRVMILRCGMDR